MAPPPPLEDLPLLRLPLSLFPKLTRTSGDELEPGFPTDSVGGPDGLGCAAQLRSPGCGAVAVGVLVAEFCAAGASIDVG